MLLAETGKVAMQKAEAVRDAAVSKAADYTFENTWLEQFLPQREVRWVFNVAALLMLIAIATWIAMKLKDLGGPVVSGVDHLTEFEDLYERGAFSDEEMSRLKQSIHSNLEPDADGTTDTDSNAVETVSESNETMADQSETSNEDSETKKTR